MASEQFLRKEIMATETLAPATHMGAVTLYVDNLERVKGFYTLGVGLAVLAEADGTVTLGRGNTALLVLDQRKDLSAAAIGSAGLYHTAVLFDTQEQLASAVYSVATKYPNLFTGSSDHFVSQAFYFDDPEGNGVELYWDYDRAKWDGQVDKMTTLYLDPNAFLREHLTEKSAEGPLGGPATIGHVHLQVGQIPEAHDFYVNKLGFELQVAYGKQALFVSAGGYHHHVGMNTWHSEGAGLRAPALGLGQVNILVPTTEEVLNINERLRGFNIDTDFDGEQLNVRDPWANRIKVTVG